MLIVFFARHVEIFIEIFSPSDLMTSSNGLHSR